jgi:hypothetical protein
MEIQTKINVIEGSYSPNDAKELLLDQCNKNITLHKIKNFSSQIRYGIEDSQALQQIDQLKDNVSIISKIVDYAALENKKLKIHSFIEITYEE